jgi:hypothetical protein
MNRSFMRVALLGPIALMAWLPLSGCVSSDARDLAKSTAANVSIVNTGLEEFKARRLAMAEGRARTADRFNKVIVEESQDLQLQLEVAKLAGESEWLNQYNAYLKLADTVVEQRRKVENAQGQMRNVILKQQKDLALPTAELSQAEKLLAELAAEPGTIEQLEFFKKYFSAVIKDYQAAKKKQEEAEEKARSATATKQQEIGSQPAAKTP